MTYKDLSNLLLTLRDLLYRKVHLYEILKHYLLDSPIGLEVKIIKHLRERNVIRMKSGAEA